MASNFKWRGGAGIDICGFPGTVKLVGDCAKDINAKANAMSKQPGAYGTTGGFKGKKGMARAFVGTRSYYGCKNNAKHNTLLKALGG